MFNVRLYEMNLIYTCNLWFKIMFANRTKMALLTFVIVSSLIRVNSVYQSFTSNTVGGQSEICVDDDGPPPAVYVPTSSDLHCHMFEKKIVLELVIIDIPTI